VRATAEKHKLGELVDFIGGGTPSRGNPDFWGGSIPWASVKDLTSSVLECTAETITEDGLKNSATNLVPHRTVIIATRVGLGKVSINRIPVAINQDLKALRLKRTWVSPEYLFYFMLSKAHWIEKAGVGATVKGVTIREMERIEISVPPLSEQERIVKILDAANELRKLRQQADRCTADLIPAIFHDMFGDPATNTKGWPEKVLSEVGSLDRGRSRHRPRDAAHLFGGPYPFIQTGEIANSMAGLVEKYSQTYSKAGLQQSKMWPKGTLCITIAANIAKTAMLGFDACFPDSIVGFTAGDQVDVEYIRAWFETVRARLEEAAPQSAQKNINLGILRKLIVSVPPIEQQREFAARVAEVREMEARQTESHRRLDDLFQSLLHRAFEGEL
jgi:type I restriction enzyme S subunit